MSQILFISCVILHINKHNVIFQKCWVQLVFFIIFLKKEMSLHHHILQIILRTNQYDTEKDIYIFQAYMLTFQCAQNFKKQFLQNAIHLTICIL